MQQFQLHAGCVLRIEEGDLTKAAVDAIVNAAHEWMLGGGGVDGAIHRAAGPGLLEACRSVTEVSAGVRCPRGGARITPGFDLPADYVIHTVGPVYRSAEESAPILASAYRSSLDLANANDLETIAFPAISCGVYRYPPAAAAAIAFETCRQHSGDLKEIRFLLFGRESYDCWLEVAQGMFKPSA